MDRICTPACKDRAQFEKKDEDLNVKYEDFIGVYDRSITNHLCEELVNNFNDLSRNNLTYNSSIEDNGDSYDRIDEYAHLIHIESVHYRQIFYKLCSDYSQSLQNCLSDYKQKYNIKWPTTIPEYKIHRAKEGEGFFRFHVEQGPFASQVDRILAYMTYLKIPNSGGETEFLYQKKRYEPAKLRTLIWPAGFTHPHRGNPVLNGEKIYITGWINLDWR